MKRLFWFLLACLVVSASLMGATGEARLLRFPAIYGDQVVFTYAGDLYTVDASGGIARKLTGDEGYECFPRFSPDGKWLAFTGQYDGNTEVYLMPAQGGIPRRMTYTATLRRDNISDRMGPNNIVMTWKNTEAKVTFRSRMKSYNSFNGELFLVSTEGHLPEQLPFPRGGFCSFSPDDKKLAYNRIFREFRTWKRYRGGMADDIWIYDFATKKIENITNNPAQDIIPMWRGDKIYFLSDRDDFKRMNLYVLDLVTKETRKLTHFEAFDVKFPSLGKQAIVFENGGYIYRFDLVSEEVKKIPIQIADDRLTGRGGIVKVDGNISTYEISPDGKRALLMARGDVFTVPAEHGATRNMTQTSHIHERNSKWSPDGKWIAFISDATGEEEIYIMAGDGKGQPIQVTKGGETYKYTLNWSPDSKKIMWADRRQRLRYVDIDSKAITDIVKADAFEIRQYTWSPDSKWIAYLLPEVEGMNKIYLYSVEKKTIHEVTDGWYGVGQPAFSSDGKYLFFVSTRDFNPILGWTEFNHIYQDMARIYLLTLSKKVASPFKPKSDEVAVKQEEKDADKKKEKDKKGDSDEKKKLVVQIDLDGLKDRIVGLPITPSRYFNLTSVGNTLYYLKRPSGERQSQMAMYDLDKQKETELGQVNGYEISTDGKKMLVNQNRSYAIIDLPKGPIKIEKKLDLSSMTVRLNRKQEWAQVFDEAWRQMREFFYAPNMHGLDWEAVKGTYEPLVAHVSHGADLAYIIGEMIGELSCGHTYVTGGDMPSPERVQTGLLGAQFRRDDASGAFQVTRILRGQNWDDGSRSPLTEIGVDVSVGDYILSINGQSCSEMNNLYEALVNRVGQQVTLKVNGTSQEKGSRDVVVVPIADEANLYYFDWVQNNIRKVTEATRGKVGYLHIPDMGLGGLNEFVKYFYPQLQKKALIIDVRGNGGGFVSPMIIERLRREIAMIDMARNTVPTTDPGSMLYGPKVCLLDEFSASDGDLFPYRFKKHKMGKLIGKRSWGGVVGIRGSHPLMDGTVLNKPEFAPFDVSGKQWIIEGVGVEPDIFVDNNPAEEYAGNDQQLNKAIEVILDELKTEEKTLPPIPPYPDKSPKGKKQ